MKCWAMTASMAACIMLMQRSAVGLSYLFTVFCEVTTRSCCAFCTD